jgi:hypothetical protein
MSSSRQPIRHPCRTSLTHAQRMWLLYGFDERWSGAFASEADYAEAWAHHREELLASYYQNGRMRPLAWWIIESPLGDYPGFDEEERVLREYGLLEPEHTAPAA